MSKETSLKFLEAEISNFKNIASKKVIINGQSLAIFGGNGKSKSSFIEALLSPLRADVIPPEPIKLGEEKSSVKVKIGGELEGKEVEYNISMFFTAGNKKGRLLVERPDGETVNKPASVLKNLVGNISFDIFDFLRWSTAKQVDTLKQLSGKAVEIDMLSIDHKRIYEERTEVNRKVSDLEGIVKNHAYTDEQIELYSKELPEESIREEMNTVGADIRTYADVESKLYAFKQRQSVIRDEILREQEALASYRQLTLEKEIRIKDLEEETETVGDKINKGNEWFVGRSKPDTTEIMGRLTAATEHNKHVTKVKELADKHHELIKLKNDSLSKSEELKKIEAKKAETIKNSNLPIEGLSFTDSEIFYNNLPLDTTQINSAKIIEIGAEISMALNPNLRVIFIKEGSLLDKKSLQALIDSAEKKGYQVMVELVDPEGGEAEVSFTEDFLGKGKVMEKNIVDKKHIEVEKNMDKIDEARETDEKPGMFNSDLFA